MKPLVSALLVITIQSIALALLVKKCCKKCK